MSEPQLDTLLLRLAGFALAGALGGLAIGAQRLGGGALLAGLALLSAPGAAPMEVIATATLALAILAIHAGAARGLRAPGALAFLAALGGAAAAGLLGGAPRLSLGLYGLGALGWALAPLMRPPPPLNAWSAPAALLAGMGAGGLALGAGGLAGPARRGFGWKTPDLIWIGAAASLAAAAVYALEGRAGPAPGPMLGLVDPFGAAAMALAAGAAARLGARLASRPAQIAAHAAMALIGLATLAAALA